jgi:hypothetical protein
MLHHSVMAIHGCSEQLLVSQNALISVSIQRVLLPRNVWHVYYSALLPETILDSIVLALFIHRSCSCARASRCVCYIVALALRRLH